MLLSEAILPLRSCGMGWAETEAQLALTSKTDIGHVLVHRG